MREQSKPLAYGALSVTLAVVVLYMGSVLPTARLALLCVSGLAVVLMALRFDWRRALLVYAATAVLSWSWKAWMKKARNCFANMPKSP